MPNDLLISPYLPFGQEVCRYFLGELGAMVIPNLCSGLTDELLEAAEGLEYKQRPGVFGKRKVKQDLATADVALGTILWDAADELERSLQRYFGGSAFESRLCFTDRAVQRYPHGSIGIGRHRDRSNIRNLIVLLGIKGKARFRVYESVDGPIRVSLTFGPGDLLLLAAPGFYGADSTARPYHSVDQIDGDPYRYVLALRHVIYLEGVSNDYN